MGGGEAVPRLFPPGQAVDRPGTGRIARPSFAR